MGELTGKYTVTVNDTEYTLFLGFSGLAEMQDRHGQDFLTKLVPPDGADEGWMPPIAIVRDIVLESLQRFHGEEADRWLADDIMNANPDQVGEMIQVSFGVNDKGEGEGDQPGNGAGPKPKRP